MQLKNIIATTPTVEVYVEALIKLMAALKSNLVTIVEDGYNGEIVKRVIRQLNEADIFVSDSLDANQLKLAQALEDSDSEIVLSLLPKEELAAVLNDSSIYKMDKLWISLPIDGEALDQDELAELLPAKAQIEVILLQQQFIDLPQFRDYFLRVLKNNYQSYQLLTSYVQQVYNCTDTLCEVDKHQLAQLYQQSKSAEAVVRMTYAFAAVGQKIASDAAKERTCAHPTPECTALIMREFLTLDYTFGINDPSELAGERLRFYRGREHVLLASGMTIKAVELFNEDGKTTAYNLMSYTTGKQPTVTLSSIRPADQRKRSICSPYRPFCGQCPNVQLVDGDRHFLSIPRHYPMYLIGLFDLHGGASCQQMKATDISLPMAFIHTVWTFKQRFPDMFLLKNLDFGALLVDSCSSGKQAIETVVRAETQCFRFNQAGRNITIVPGSVFGYVSALQGDSQEALKGYFSSGDANVALVAADSDSTPRHAFTALPGARSQALALLRFLNRMHWQFVTVALSEQDPESLSAFRHFERLALDRGVCLAEVVNIGGVRVDNLPIGTTTNVTIVFATARDASAYLALTLKSHRKAVHVMMGDAHDWYLHGPENRKQLQGIVSVQPKDILHHDFREWMETTTPLTLPENWYWSYIEDRWQCALTQKSKLTYGKMCSGDELLNINTLGRMTKAGYLSRGIERFLFAMDSVYRKLCPAQAGLCLEFYESGRELILAQLKKTGVEDDVEIYEYLQVGNDEYAYRTLGNWSLTGGLRLHSLYRSFFDGPVESKCQPPMCKCFLDGDFLQRPLDSFVFASEQVDTDRSTGSYVRRQPAFGAEKVGYQSVFEHLSMGQWRQYTHNFVLLALISVLTIIAIAVLVLVLVKLYLRVVKGNQSLGISLLVGIIILYVTAYFFVFDATDLVCRLRVVMHGFGYSLCFGVMIAKATQLRNAETLGFGNAVHISFWNYWLLLFFIIGVQIALNTRWFAEPFMSTLAVSDSHSEMVCTLGKHEFVLANVYVVILLFLALFINSINRNIKRNYKETKWLFVSSVLCTLIWLGWIMAYFMIPNEIKETVIVAELICCASILLGLLFGPKIYILLSYEPVVVEYKENQANKNMALFEKDDDLPSIRAISPASSSGSSTRTTMSGQSVHVLTGNNHQDHESPVFHTVMRKKTKLRRAHSGHEMQIRTHLDVPVVHAQSARPTPPPGLRRPTIIQ
ncbi:Metabotropic glutamate receptor 7 [Trichostrongylus colubriformis]|uniref:Metabotropic glutamate receptor 7 n=1 Tax=Trichostrongylus colubriformis TaxID=6319 RepID=A0AAN8FIC6_TRICO